MEQRVVVTGMGLCSSLGRTGEQVVASFRQERTAFVASERLPGCIVCPVADDGGDAAAGRLGAWRHRRYLARGAGWAVLAGLRAVENAGFETVPGDMDLFGCAAPTLDFEAEPGLPPGDPLFLDALWLLRWLPATPLSVLASLLDVHGQGVGAASACASALAALGEAWFRIRHGACTSALVACGDSRLSRGALLGYAKARVLSREKEPALASRPFDAARSGFVPGEGGAAFVLESLEHARARGARVLAEILGFGASLDAGSLTAPDADGIHAEAAVRRALACARLDMKDVAWISAHGTGTVANDQCEAGVLGRLLGESGAAPAVLALKSWIGHGSSACGALELALSLACTGHGFLPAIRNLERPIADLPFVCRPLSVPCESVGLLENFGFGGQNAALVVRSLQGHGVGPGDGDDR